MVIDYLSTHSYIVIMFHNNFDNNISLALDFRTFLKNIKMSSSLSKILETGINVFKSNSQIIKNNNIMKYQLKRNATKIYDDYWS